MTLACGKWFGRVVDPTFWSVCARLFFIFDLWAPVPGSKANIGIVFIFRPLSSNFGHFWGLNFANFIRKNSQHFDIYGNLKLLTFWKTSMRVIKQIISKEKVSLSTLYDFIFFHNSCVMLIFFRCDLKMSMQWNVFKWRQLKEQVYQKTLQCHLFTFDASGRNLKTLFEFLHVVAQLEFFRKWFVFGGKIDFDVLEDIFSYIRTNF